MRFAALSMVMMAMMSGASIQVHGHRGARAVRPENTLPAYEYAIAQGVDVLEMDMAVTKDGVIVMSHDPHMNPAICTGPKGNALIHDLTLAEVREYDCGAKANGAFPRQQAVPGTKMPTLDEVLELQSRGDFLFNIETKIFPDHPEYTVSPEKFVELFLAVIRKHHAEKRVILQSFDFRTLVAMKKIAPEITRCALIGTKEQGWVESAKVSEATIVSPMYRLVTREKVAEAQAAGLQVVPWTPNTREEWQRMMDAKVDGIITDDPAGLLGMLGRGK